MNALHKLQNHVTNDLRTFRHEYFPGGMERFHYAGDNPKRGDQFKELKMKFGVFYQRRFTSADKVRVIDFE